MRKPDFRLCKNKGAEKLCSYCLADQCLCFHYSDIDSTVLLLVKSDISSFYTISLTVHAGSCRIWAETQDRFSRVAAPMLRNIIGQEKGNDVLVSMFEIWSSHASKCHFFVRLLLEQQRDISCLNRGLHFYEKCRGISERNLYTSQLTNTVYHSYTNKYCLQPDG